MCYTLTKQDWRKSNFGLIFFLATSESKAKKPTRKTQLCFHQKELAVVVEHLGLHM